MQIILASQSPRRREALSQMGLKYTWIEPMIDETLPDGIQAQQGVMLLAARKAQVVSGKNPQAICVGSDTLVVLGERIMGKPKDEEEAFDMLQSLSGNCHDVYTGLCVCQRETGKSITDFRRSVVRFLPLTERQIRNYIATAEPMDKAGAYGIQGRAGAFIHGIVGSYDNVVGLPMALLRQMLLEFDIDI